MEMGDIKFLIIGATKSATTWLQQSLQLDPQVYMPDPEIHYFSRYSDRGDQWYLDNIKPPSESLLIGEKSNSYLDTPAAAGRIHRSLPNVQLVAQLRNPVERAYSDYCMLHRRGDASADIERYLDPRQGAGGRFLEGGLYFQQLRRSSFSSLVLTTFPTCVPTSRRSRISNSLKRRAAIERTRSASGSKACPAKTTRSIEITSISPRTGRMPTAPRKCAKLRSR